MISLIDSELYAKLASKRAEMEHVGIRNLAPVFVPVGPTPSERIPLRLLFVGQATHGNLEDALLGFEGGIAKSTRVIIDALMPRKRPLNSPFWQAVRRILEYALCTTNAVEWTPRLHELVGWSNLVKIGDAKGNTGSCTIAEQSTLCVEALRAEIGSLRPLATILLSGNFARDEIFYPTFGHEGWRSNVEAEGRVSVKNHVGLGALIWAHHPLDMRRRGIEQEALGFMGGYVAALGRR
jgi:hypothetical protein